MYKVLRVYCTTGNEFPTMYESNTYHAKETANRNRPWLVPPPPPRGKKMRPVLRSKYLRSFCSSCLPRAKFSGPCAFTYSAGDARFLQYEGASPTGRINRAGIPASRQYTLHESVRPSCSAYTCVRIYTVNQREDARRMFIHTGLVSANLRELLPEGLHVQTNSEDYARRQWNKQYCRWFRKP